MQEHKRSQNASANNTDLERWNSIAREYDALITRGDFFRMHLLNPAMREVVGPVAGKEILDAGCGQGYLAYELAREGATVTGVDGAERLIEIARSRYAKTGGLRFTTLDLTEHLPFADASFDIVIANMVLMDLDPIERLMKCIARVLKPNGTFVFSLLHPLFETGSLHKNLREFVSRKPPHYAITRYITPHKIPWRIPGAAVRTSVYHRPLSAYVRALRNAGLAIDELREPTLPADEIAGKSGALRTLAEIPMFLVARAVKLPRQGV